MKAIDRMLGTDLTQVDRFNTLTALTVVSEVGPGMSKWKTEKHFTAGSDLHRTTKYPMIKYFREGQ